MITIIDYKSGNLKSISNGFKKIGVDYQITDDKDIIADSDYLVLPGVGAFGSAMENLKPFEDIIHEHVNDNKPFLGICLGQQVLMNSHLGEGVGNVEYANRIVVCVAVEVFLIYLGSALKRLRAEYVAEREIARIHKIRSVLTTEGKSE